MTYHRGHQKGVDKQVKQRWIFLMRSAMAGRLYKLQSKQTSNSAFDQTLMPCSGYVLFAGEQGVGYQISWVEVNCP